MLWFLDRSRYFIFQVPLQLYSRCWVDPVPDPLLLRKSGSAWNRTRTSGCSQELWPLDHRSGHLTNSLRSATISGMIYGCFDYGCYSASRSEVVASQPNTRTLFQRHRLLAEQAVRSTVLSLDKFRVISTEEFPVCENAVVAVFREFRGMFLSSVSTRAEEFKPQPSGCDCMVSMP
jgi:hypothetical protein